MEKQTGTELNHFITLIVFLFIVQPTKCPISPKVQSETETEADIVLTPHGIG